MHVIPDATIQATSLPTNHPRIPALSDDTSIHDYAGMDV